MMGAVSLRTSAGNAVSCHTFSCISWGAFAPQASEVPATGHKEDGSTLPDAAGVGANHGVVGFAGERFGELRHVTHDAVDPVFVGRMLVGDGVHPLTLRTLVAASPLRHTDEEALIGREAVDGLKILPLGGILPCHVGQNGSSEIGHILAKREFAVDLN